MTAEQERALAAAAAGALLHGTNRSRRRPSEFHSSTLAALARKGLLIQGFDPDRERYEYGHPSHYTKGRPAT